jgi:hypothetical protein
VAKQIIHKLIDDLDGDDATETVRFAYDGVDYTIDLSAKNATKLRRALKTYVEHGAKATPSRAGRHTSERTTRADRADIRAWARASGRYPQLGVKGRIPAEVVAAYRQAAGANRR